MFDLKCSVIPSCSAICFTSRKNISLPVYQYPQDSRSTFRLSADSCRISVYADGYIAGVVALISLWAYSHRPARVSSLTKATDTAKAVSVAFGRGFKDLTEGAARLLFARRPKFSRISVPASRFWLKTILRIVFLTPKPSRVQVLLFYRKNKESRKLRLFLFLAGAEGLEPSARGFGDRCSTN